MCEVGLDALNSCRPQDCCTTHIAVCTSGSPSLKLIFFLLISYVVGACDRACRSTFLLLRALPPGSSRAHSFPRQTSRSTSAQGRRHAAIAGAESWQRN